MKIKLPNPDDFEQDIDGFLEQLELSVHHAKKSWDKMKKKYETLKTDGTIEEPYVAFILPFLEKNYDDYFKIVDGRHDQEIEIEIITP